MNKILNLIWLILFVAHISCQNNDKEDREKFELALSLFNEENYKQAIVYLDTLLEAHPTNYAAWCLKGRSLFSLGQEADGIKAIDKAIALESDYYAAYGYRAIMKSLQTDANYDEVVSDFRVAIENEPENANFAKPIAGFMANRGHLEEALEALEYFLNIDSTDYQANVLHAHLIGEMGNNEDALNILNEIILYQDASQFTAFEERAYVYQQLKRYDSAIADYNKLLKRIEKDTSFTLLTAYTYNNRGYAKFKSERAEDALVDINYSIYLEQTNSYAFRNRGEVLIQQNRITEGCEDLRKASDLGFSLIYGDELDTLIEKYCK